MRPSRLVGLASVALSLGAAAFGADAPAATPCHAVVKPSKSEVALGERFTVEVVGKGPAGTTWTFPTGVEGDQADLEALQGEAAQAAPAGSQSYRAVAYAIGEVTLPALAVRCKPPGGTEVDAASDPVTIKVTSVLPKSADGQTLADIRPFVPVSVGWIFWLALGLAVVVVTGVVIWLARRLRRRRTTVEPAAREPEVPPDVQARQALDGLARGGLLDRGDYRGYYIELTTIAKTYLERRLDAPVAEMTSSEMLGFLRQRPELGPVSSPMRDLATVADFVKFARGGGERSEAERHLASVRELVEGMERIQTRAAQATSESSAAAGRRA